MTNTDAPSASPRRKVGRRTLLKGAAWTIPTVVVSTSAPMAAASGILRSEVLLFTGSGCVASGAALPAPFAEAHAWDRDGVVPITEATFLITSTDGGTVTVGGQTYPGSAIPLTRTATSGAVYLSGVTTGSPGTVTVAANMTTADGRTTGVDSWGTLTIC